jgi:transposase InsO family protein
MYFGSGRLHVVGGNSQRVDIIGHTTLSVDVGGCRQRATFQIAAHFPVDVLLGLEAIHDTIRHIDFESRTITSKSNRTFRYGVARAAAKASAQNDTIKLTADVTVPPRCKVLLVVQLEGNHIDTSVIGVSPVPVPAENWLDETLAQDTPQLKEEGDMADRLLVENLTLGIMGNMITLPVFNPLDQPMELKAGRAIATLFTLMSRDEALRFEREQADRMSPQERSDREILHQEEYKRAMAELTEMLNRTDLSETERKQLEAVAKQYPKVWRTGRFAPVAPGLPAHTINTTGGPIRRRPYRLSLQERTTVEATIQELQRHNLIRVSSSPWAAPVVLVRKKDGSPRFCIDYRGLNAVTITDSYPLPRIDDMLDRLAGFTIASAFDLPSAYHQNALDEASREKTAFVTASGLYEWTTLPQGLKNAPAAFQRGIDLLLNGIRGVSALVYLDDIIIFSHSFEEHLQHLHELFRRLEGAGVSLKVSKCRFACTELEYLGHIVSSRGVCVDPKKTDAIRNARAPRNISEVRTLLGACSYYRRFMPKFSTVAEPITRLLRKDAPWSWSSEQEQAYGDLKRMLCEAPILAYPDFGKPFRLETDASLVGISGVLTQLGPSGMHHPIAYYSRTLTTAERNWCTYERECLAIVEATKHFRPYLYGCEFELLTDHQALESLMKARGTPGDSHGKLQRWHSWLSQFNFAIHHRPGEQNIPADPFSRPPFVAFLHASPAVRPLALAAVWPLDVAERRDGARLSMYEAATRALVLALPTVPDWLEAQRSDPLVRTLIEYLEDSKLPEEPKLAALIPKYAKDLCIGEDKRLYRTVSERGKADLVRTLVVPRSLQARVLKACHDDALGGHFGERRTLRKARQRFWWPEMASTVQYWVKSCANCQSRKQSTARPAGLLQPIHTDHPGQVWSVDIYGPLPVSEKGNKYVFAFTDHFTRWVEAWATSEVSSEVVAKLLVRVVHRYGCMEQLLSDRGSQFLSDAMGLVYEMLGIKKISTTAWHPQTNGLTERWNKTLGDGLATLTDPAGPYGKFAAQWDDALKWFTCAYNTSVHDVTGYTPFFLQHGREMRLPIDVALGIMRDAPAGGYDEWVLDLGDRLELAHKLAQASTLQRREKDVERYNAKHRDIRFEVGQQVWLYLPQRLPGDTKWAHKWDGPYKILHAAENGLTYQLGTEDGHTLSSRISVQRLRPYFSAMHRPPFDPLLAPDDNFNASEERYLERLAGGVPRERRDRDYEPETEEASEEEADHVPLTRQTTMTVPSTPSSSLTWHQTEVRDGFKNVLDQIAVAATCNVPALAKTIRQTILADKRASHILVTRLMQAGSREALMEYLRDAIINIATYLPPLRA